MVNTLAKTTLREIRQSLGRYLAILAIIAIGVAIFAGLRMSEPDMIETGVVYLDEQQFYDRVAYSKDCVNYFRWNFLHGEEELAPGLRVLPAPGHTRGSQIVLLDTEEGAVCFPGDTVTTQLNLEKNLQPNIVVNDKQLFESMDLVRRVAQRIIFSHDDAIKTGMRGGFYKVPNPWEK